MSLSCCPASSAKHHQRPACRHAPTAVPRKHRRPAAIRASFDVDTEPASRAPNAAPGRWGSVPPPPPPPPPVPPQAPRSGLQPPSRRDALWALAGSALGAGLTTVYYQARYPALTEEGFAAAIDAVLDDPDLANLMADEIMLSEYGQNLQRLDAEVDDMRNTLLTEAVAAQEAAKEGGSGGSDK